MSNNSPLHTSEEALLQSALNSAFEPTSIPRSPAASSPASLGAPGLPAEAPPPDPTPPSDISASELDAWKESYEHQLAEWKKENAAAREKAENNRRRYEEQRAKERAERRARGEAELESWEHLGTHITSSIVDASHRPTLSVSEAYTPNAARHLASVSHNLGAVAGSSKASDSATASVPSVNVIDASGSSASVPEASPSDARDLVFGEPQHSLPPHGGHVKVPSSPSQKWDTLSDPMTSSYPSLSYPQSTAPGSPQQRPQAPSIAEGERGEPKEPPSTIPSILDTAVSKKTRGYIIMSSIAINLFLPFLNGVMLGFGEIFAKNVLVNWIGWKKAKGSASVAGGVGMRK
ncbi:hypothetical protein CONPUDRAFT_135625 [Coniophora puteana RWD-64-598 SS2]|uniref:TOM13-domain-containing protein n=1 Tax=Coniophora puteana (strain RWD-64-598) TaxID=741705 RepID=A0A5M3MY07_CONPW|nr:uncharacterized protein CONPUDRAFT_135625 [Coniophora puteana RWD-64-598 SS2]EIW84018.1 hypothetical protein CONPUDRAFT_135625 [Coniophora puteana RWD-64-598 SS2]